MLQLQASCPEENASAIIEEGTWKHLRSELEFLIENSVRDYRLSTMYRPSSVAVAAVFNAIEQVEGQYYEALVSSLVRISREFDFDEPSVLLDAKIRLSVIMIMTEIEEGGDAGVDDVEFDAGDEEVVRGVEYDEDDHQRRPRQRESSVVTSTRRIGESPSSSILPESKVPTFHFT